jgi:TonB family protein
MRKVMHIALLAIASVGLGNLTAQVKAPWEMPESSFGGAIPKNRDKWVTFRDYPPSALRRNEQGFVVVNFVITADGKVANCQVAQSSGHSTLDDVPCRLLERRAKFDPATDASGVATATNGTASFPFWIP